MNRLQKGTQVSFVGLEMLKWAYFFSDNEKEVFFIR